MLSHHVWCYCKRLSKWCKRERERERERDGLCLMTMKILLMLQDSQSGAVHAPCQWSSTCCSCWGNNFLKQTQFEYWLLKSQICQVQSVELNQGPECNFSQLKSSCLAEGRTLTLPAQLKVSLFFDWRHWMKTVTGFQTCERSDSQVATSECVLKCHQSPRESV